MTVRPKNILENENSSISVCYQTLQVDEPSGNLSPPNKRLRLSLKRQKIVGSTNHSKKGINSRLKKKKKKKKKIFYI
jgi:hypothetical protein